MPVFFCIFAYGGAVIGWLVCVLLRVLVCCGWLLIVCPNMCVVYVVCVVVSLPRAYVVWCLQWLARVCDMCVVCCVRSVVVLCIWFGSVVVCGESMRARGVIVSGLCGWWFGMCRYCVVIAPISTGSESPSRGCRNHLCCKHPDLSNKHMHNTALSLITCTRVVHV